MQLVAWLIILVILLLVFLIFLYFFNFFCDLAPELDSWPQGQQAVCQGREEPQQLLMKERVTNFLNSGRGIFQVDDFTYTIFDLVIVEENKSIIARYTTQCDQIIEYQKKCADLEDINKEIMQSITQKDNEMAQKEKELKAEITKYETNLALQLEKSKSDISDHAFQVNSLKIQLKTLDEANTLKCAKLQGEQNNAVGEKNRLEVELKLLRKQLEDQKIQIQDNENRSEQIRVLTAKNEALEKTLKDLKAKMYEQTPSKGLRNMINIAAFYYPYCYFKLKLQFRHHRPRTSLLQRVPICPLLSTARRPSAEAIASFLLFQLLRSLEEAGIKSAAHPS